jgi:hypothetical protein
LLRRRSKPVWPWKHCQRAGQISGSSGAQRWIKVESRNVWQQLNRLVNALKEGIEVEYRHGGQQRCCGSTPRRRTARRRLERLVTVLFIVVLSVKEEVVKIDHRHIGRRWWDRRHHSVRNIDGNEVHSRSRVNDLEVNELENLTFDREPVVRQHLGSETGCIKQVLWSSVGIDENIEVMLRLSWEFTLLSLEILHTGITEVNLKSAILRIPRSQKRWLRNHR